MLAVPRTALGLATGEAVSLDFKWWDNSQQPGDIMNAYLSGDVAPDGRFNYRYLSSGAKAAANAPDNQRKSAPAPNRSP